MIRPRFLIPAALLASLGGAIIAASAEPNPPPLSDVPESVAHDGILSVTLEAKTGKTNFDGVSVDTIAYNGIFAGPVLRLWPGDKLRVHFQNRLAEPSNLHFHGMQTSPRGNSDNVHLLVPAGKDFDYEVKIPRDQPPGTYWYHAHPHGLSEKQVGLGLSGALIVEGLANRVPNLGAVRERLFTLKTVEMDDSEDPKIAEEWHGVIATINGQTNIEEAMRPGEAVLWHVGNQSSNLAAHLALDGHKFTVVARDGNLVPAPVEAEVLDIGPASRLDVLVTGGAPGVYGLVARNVLTGQDDKMSPNRTIGHVTIGGAAVSAPKPTAPKLEDLSQLSPKSFRTFVFTQSKDSEKFFMNDRLFDHARVDTRVNLGDVEDWTIRNDSDDMHVFHIHQLPFQVMAVNDKPVPFEGLLDTVRVPERGSVKIRLAFLNPDIVGKFMYHCHVLKHEDKGMMQVIEVVDPKAVKHAGLARWLAALVRRGTPPDDVVPICSAWAAG